MIYTVTFNPALDYIVEVKDFRIGLTNRTASELMLPGGKGINVSAVLKNLGHDNTAFGFIAGFTGDEIAKRVEQMGITADFIRIGEGNSRINIKLKSGEETEINGRGPDIGEAQVKELFVKLDSLKDGDILVLSGSIPSSLPNTIYQDILEHLQYKKLVTVVDACGDLLLPVLRYHPFLIKPNHHELGEMFRTHISTPEQAACYGKKLQDMGAQNVLVSMSTKGAVLLTKDGGCYEKQAPRGRAVNSVGAGDSMVAGFLAGWLEKQDYRYALDLGVAAGSASAFSDLLADRKSVEAVLYGQEQQGEG